MHFEEVGHLFSHLDISWSGCIVETCAGFMPCSSPLSSLQLPDVSVVINSFAQNPHSPGFSSYQDKATDVPSYDFALDATQPLSYEIIRAQHGMHIILAYPPPHFNLCFKWYRGQDAATFSSSSVMVIGWGICCILRLYLPLMLRLGGG